MREELFDLEMLLMPTEEESFEVVEAAVAFGADDGTREEAETVPWSL